MDKDPQQRARQARAAGLALQVGTQLVASIVIGAVIGYYLDKRFHTDPYLLSAGVLLGSVAGFREMLVLLKRINKDS